MLIKFKDYFTVATTMLGFAVLLFSFEQKFQVASVLIIAGIFFDLMDGFVARITRTKNKFGAEFDTISDLVIYSMAPAIITFFMFYGYNKWYALIIGSFPLLFGCLRLARFNVKRIEYPGYWIGLTRPASALLIIAFLNSGFFNDYRNYLVAGIYIALISALNIALLPYIGHHARKFKPGLKAIISLMILALIASIPLGYFWDVLFIYSLLYLLSPLYMIPKEEKIKIKNFIREWKQGD